ncbi:hypothetical protein C2E20_1723 [Micractinium conductrix]|uniref:RWP-RK domain-containing protein n=1 Tax=Micractinium conductrix TaxID=554055 RepID=A0A2P6VM08_9CHLO|nr:hypothetical protein C2E20_1723 [Micractinium conductrix]|eukprot:PSC75128.1 hypothetical protein C2E20_1723 [Micractinium conductrix]
MRPQRTRRPTDKSREAALQQENTWRGPKRHAAAQPAYPHPQQRTRRGGLGGTAAAADPAPRAPSASASESSEDEAQAALLQLAALAVGEELEDEEEQEQQQQQEQPAGAPTARVQHPPVEHLPPPPQALLRCPIQPPQTVQQKQEHVKPQEQQQEQPGASPTAAASPAPPPQRFCTPLAAPSPSIQTATPWLAAMQLSPLVNLQALPSPLEQPGWGWVRGTATPVADMRTPAGLLRVTAGTPLSQAAGLPHPSSLDFGGPSVPPPPPSGGEWDAADGGAAAAAPCRQPSADAVPRVVMTLPLRPHSRSGVVFNAGDLRFKVAKWTVGLQAAQQAGDAAAGGTPGGAAPPPHASPALVPQDLPGPPPPPVPTGAAYLRMVAPPKVAAAAAETPGSAARGSVGSSPTVSAASVEGSQGASLPRGRSRRQRRQRAQCAEFHWSDEGEEEAAGEEEAHGSSRRKRSPAPDSSDDDSDASTSPGGSDGKAGRGLRRAASASRLQQHVQQSVALRRIQGLLHLAAPTAAEKMGMRPSAFRALCRSLGISRWPNRRPAS